MQIDKMKLYGWWLVGCVALFFISALSSPVVGLWQAQAIAFVFVLLGCWCEHVYDKEVDRREKGE